MKAAQKIAAPAPEAPRLQQLVGRQVLIMLANDKPDDNLGQATIEGMFATEKKALEHVKDDSLANYSPDGPIPDGDDPDWGSPFLVCEIKRIVRPVPHVKTTMKVVDAAGGKT